jgi:hypothetical protein
MTILDDLLVPCSCCRGDRSTNFIGSVGFCEGCRPSEDLLEDWDATVALVDALSADRPPPCPHGSARNYSVNN